MNNFTKRAIFGVIYAGLIALCTTNHPYLFISILLLFSGLCFFEFKKLVGFNDVFYFILSIVAAGFIFYYYGSNFLDQVSPFYMSTLKFAPNVLFLIACFTILFSSEELQGEFAKATISVVYIIVPFALAMIFPTIYYEFGNKKITYEILFIFVLIWTNDTLAYFVGSRFGKHKLMPKISANKSWEGFIAGVISCILVGFLIETYQPNLKGNWITIGIIVAFSAPIGDLIESKLKRTFDTKDSANIIPGHGGFLDRLDSFIFTIPMVYTYFLIDYLL